MTISSNITLNENGLNNQSRVELRIDDGIFDQLPSFKSSFLDPTGVSAQELAGNLSPPSLDFNQIYPDQSRPCERCTDYLENAQRAYKVVQGLANQRQENLDLRKVR
jgi:hypothetical protein